jgi:hypothetical protein
MKTAIIVFGALRQSDVCSPSWVFPFDADFHLVTWDQTQQAGCFSLYSAVDSVAALSKMVIFKTVSVLNYDAFVADFSPFPVWSRMWYLWYHASKVIADRGYERVILIRPDTILYPVDTIPENFDVGDLEVLIPTPPTHENRYCDDWFFVMRWSDFVVFANRFPDSISDARCGKFTNPHNFIYTHFADRNIQMTSQKAFRIVQVRPNSKKHAGEQLTADLVQTIQEETDDWRKMTGQG